MEKDEAADWLSKIVQCMTEETKNSIRDCTFEGQIAGVKRIDMRNLEFRVRGNVMFIRGRSK